MPQGIQYAGSQPGGAAGAPRDEAAPHAVGDRPPPGVAALLLARLEPSAVPWALWRLARGGAPLREVKGLRFARVMGSGRGGGFGVRPGLDHQGVFAMFDSAQDAEAYLARSPFVAAYRQRAIECFTAVLLVTQARGSWAGQTMQPVAETPAHGPLAVLTRAAIRPSRAHLFWRQTAPSQAALMHAEGCVLAAGLGEAPLVRQATFSIWQSVEAMNAYARRGAHQEAASAVVRAGCFSESMFLRFVPLALQGRWQGREHG